MVQLKEFHCCQTWQPAGTFDYPRDFNLWHLILFLVFDTRMLFPLWQYLLCNSCFKTIPIVTGSALGMKSLKIFIALRLGKNGIEYPDQVTIPALTTILASVPLALLNKYFYLHNTIPNNFYRAMMCCFLLNISGA